MKKRFFLSALVVICFFMEASTLRAQSHQNNTQEEGNDEDNDFPDDPGETDVPFDDGVYWLVTAGACYGICTAFAKKRTEAEVDKKKKPF